MDYQKIMEDIYQEILPFAQKGKQADYIPALAKVNPDQFGNSTLNTLLEELASVFVNTGNVACRVIGIGCASA